ncbi:MAG: DNA-3-methyladenine glycosylase 2 family protein [Saprospiraceae bacterium]|nr:DNA-3-methyladenine glycosylase 2 family protein [Saprospiraceae bacterium]
MSNSYKQHLQKNDKLKDLVALVDLPKLEDGNVYQSLMKSIVSQQLSTKVADVIWGRFINLFDDKKPHPLQIIDFDIETMKSVGLSGQKANYIKNVSIYFTENNLIDFDWSGLSDEEIIQILTKIKGVGVWTVQMILIFTLKRPDVFPVLDLGIQQGIKKLYALESSGKILMQEMEQISEEWRPYRSYASRIIWKWKDTKI